MDLIEKLIATIDRTIASDSLHANIKLELVKELVWAIKAICEANRDKEELSDLK